MRRRKYERTASIKDRDNSPNPAQIGNIFISNECESGQVILILDNRGETVETIDIYYKESGKVPKELRKGLQVPCDNPQKVPLLKGFEKWERLSFQVGEKTGNVSNEILKKLADKAKKQRQIQPSHYQTESLTSKIEQSDNFPATPAKPSNLSEQSSRLTNPHTCKESLISDSSKPTSYNVPECAHQENNSQQVQQQIDLQSQIAQVNARLEQMVRELKTEIENLKEQSAEHARENCELKAMLDTQTDLIFKEMEPVFYKAANHVLQMTFAGQKQTDGRIFHNPSRMCEMIKAELDKFKKQFNEQENYIVSLLYQQLAKVEELMKFKASEMSSPEKFWENNAKELAELVLADEPPNEMPFFHLGELIKVYWEDLKTYKLKLPQAVAEAQSILYRIPILLMDGFSLSRAHNAEEAETMRSFYENCLPNILEIMNLEIVPIQIGQTDADSRIHDIQDTRRGAFKPGVVVDIIQHGVRRISDQKIIKKPVVMRGEPE